MVLHAFEDIDDALAVTRSFLTPVDRTLWVKLAFVAFFIGGPGAGFNTFQYTFGDGTGGVSPGGPGPGPGSGIGPRTWLLVGAVVLAVFLLALAFALVGAIMEFVFVESLRTQTVTIRRYWGRRWGQGLRLFGFRLIVGVFVFAFAALFAAPFVLSMLGVGGVGAGFEIALFVLLVPLFLVLAVVAGLVNGFTTVFVVPVMVLEDCGVLDGWRRLWPSLTNQWQQYLAYAVAGFVLSLVGGIVVGIVTVVLALLLLVPFGVLFAIGVGVLAVAEPLGIGLLVIVGVLYVLAIFVVAALAQVPVQTYLRYYALLVLGDVDSDLDLIPDLRTNVREETA
ncbi:MAG: hypothetical protein ABEI96_05615 [Haloarculaceae archaeon]